MVGWDGGWGRHEGWWHDAGKAAAAWRLEDLAEGQEVEGSVEKVTDRGIFVDFGCVCHGLLPPQPYDANANVQAGDWLEGLVIARVDLQKGRVSLRRRLPAGRRGAAPSAKGGGRQGREREGGYSHADANANSADAWSNWHQGGYPPTDSRPGSNDAAEAWGSWHQGGAQASRGTGARGAREAEGSWQERHWEPVRRNRAEEQHWEPDPRSRVEDWWAEEEHWPPDKAHSSNGSLSTRVDEQRQLVRVDEAASRARPAEAASSRQERARLKQSLFRKFDLDGDGYLRCPELQGFAECMGYEGSNEEWGQRYRVLCKIFRCSLNKGLDEESFAAHLDGQGEQRPPYRDEQLRRALERASQPPEAEGGWQIVQDRAKLKELVFRRLDQTGCGRLGSSALRAFAERTGFSGSDEDWEEEYEMLCQDSGCSAARGLDEATWSRLVDDNSDSGCFCGDEDLQSLLQQLGPPPKAAPQAAVPKAAPQAAGPKAVPQAAGPKAAAQAQPAQASQPTQAPREQLKRRAFEGLDTDGNGRLRCDELRRFGALTGFEGSDGEWAAECMLLCSELGCDPTVGLDFAAFSRMVDDDSDKGCYCSDSELDQMAHMEPASPPVAPAPPAPLPPPQAQRAPQPPLAKVPPQAQRAPQARDPSQVAPKTPDSNVGAAAGVKREELKARVFTRLDVGKRGRLGSAEFRPFAEVCGFEGDDAEWKEEFRLLCEGLGCDAGRGLDFASFCKVLDDESDDGLYVSQEELISFLERPAPSSPASGATAAVKPYAADVRAPAPSPSAVRPPVPGPAHGGAAAGGTATVEQAGPPKSREEVKARIFKRLDVDSNGFVGRRELLPFVRQTGFDGVEAEWDEEYDLLCKEMGCRPDVGLSAEQFMAMVDDQSEQGCYCSDEELRAVLVTLDPQVQATSGPKGQTAKDPAVPPQPKGKGQTAPQPKAKGQALQPSAGDPWAAQVDPWSTPSAKRVTEQQRKAAAAEGEENWGKWRDGGKPGAESDPKKPAMDPQKLLEASRAMIAARRAKEEEEKAEKAEKAEKERAAQQQQQRQQHEARERGEASSSSDAYGPKAVSMQVALASVGAAIAHIALGDGNAVRDLISAVLCAPCVVHALAAASNAVRLLLQNRVEEARLLLAVDELHLLAPEGDIVLLGALGSLARSLGAQGAPFLIRVMLAALVKIDDKQAAARAAATTATEEIVTACDAWAFEALLPGLKAALDPKRSPAMKLHALRLLARCQVGREGGAAVAQRLPQLLPAAAALLVDTNVEVKAAAGDTVERLLGLCGNSDLEPHLEEVLCCYKGSTDVSAFVPALAEVVFVQQVEAPALAVMMPVLTKGLKSRSLRTQRQTCVIAANMCKLVSSVTDVEPFAPQLLPQLKRISEEASDPDVRAVAGRAHSCLLEVADNDAAGNTRAALRAELSVAAVAAEAEAGTCDGPSPCPAPVRDVVLDYVVMLAAGLGKESRRSEEEWRKRLAPLLDPLLGMGRVSGLVQKLRGIAGCLAGPCRAEPEVPADDVGSDEESLGLLCDCSLTLACGAATLLTGARLRLLRGRVYGLVGANDSGKSTLLRSLHERRVVGFPPAGCLVTALVEHGVGEKPPESDRTPLEFVLSVPAIKALGLEASSVTAVLRSLGFDEGSRLKKPIRTLSGGWRVKLGLACAMLQKPDVLLLDEPTGHLDAAHITWLVDYINGLKADKLRPVTALVVSHDAPFLDRVCTDVIHVCDARLRSFHGSLSQFLGAHPDAQLGLTAREEDARPLAAFSLPEPGSLEGVRSKGRRFLYLEDVYYSYPSGNSPAVRRASVECCLKSRVAIVGPNGAGKSTLAALVVGELAPDQGSSWRHPNLRVAFVAQHAFHHLERHMDLTATEYILRRFQGNEDHEAADNRVDEAECSEPRNFRLEGERLVPCNDDEADPAQPEAVVGRRQRGRLGFEYEVRWQGSSATTWVTGPQLAAMGHAGMSRREDERQAAQRSLSDRPLTTPSVEAHLANFGLDAEMASHRRLGALSHGQRARAVLAAATWLAPHLLVLDEPTNYLDRPGLAALAAGLQSFGGGVMVISHTAAFLEEVCSERWVMEQGTLRRKGSAPADTEEAREVEASTLSAAALAVAKSANKDKKRLKRMKELRRKNGEKVSDDEEDWWGDLLRKANSPQ